MAQSRIVCKPEILTEPLNVDFFQASNLPFMLKNVVSESEERSSPEMITNDKTLQISYSEEIQGRYYKKGFCRETV